MVVRGTGRNFNEAVSGDTIFLRHTS